MAGRGLCGLIEPVQGEGGVIPAHDGYLAGVCALCDRDDALLMLDDIQCGIARTGPLFAHWGDGVVPDIVTLAKALGGGMPSARRWLVLKSPRRSSSARLAPHSAAIRWGLRSRAWFCANCSRRRSSRTSADRAAHCAMAWPLSAATRAEVRGRGQMLVAELAPAYAARAGDILDQAAADSKAAARCADCDQTMACGSFAGAGVFNSHVGGRHSRYRRMR
jgi:acetylornithine/N-succinyldiaminopimelate aminotransferase